MGHNTAFISKVGNDFFGDQLRAAIKEAGIDDIGLCIDEKIHTTLAMVHTYPDGDRDFSFYRNPGADMMLNKAEICEDILKNTKIFHFGTLSMTNSCQIARKSQDFGHVNFLAFFSQSVR